MLVLGVILLLIGAFVAALVERTIGLLIAAVGLLLILIPLITDAAGNDAVLKVF